MCIRDSNTDVPVPKTYALCEDTEIIGTAFYIMEFMNGRVLWDPSMADSSKEEALAAMQQKEIAAQRKLQLEEIGFEGEEAVATLEQFSELDDATFEQIIAVMKKRYSKQDEEKEEPKEAPAAQAELDEEVDTAEASEEVLEDAQESEEVVLGLFPWANRKVFPFPPRSNFSQLHDTLR